MSDQVNEGFITPHGGYENLKSYQMAEIVFDLTHLFCEKYISTRTRTYDQMIQAARSGKQNIAEGSMASGVSKKSEIYLIGIARASLEELLIDYKDFLRLKDLALWEKNDHRVSEIRSIGSLSDRSYRSYKTYIEDYPVEVAVNAIICVIHQTNYLIDQLKRKLEKMYLESGGVGENMYKARRNYKKR
jgi:four helix bundle suffix protein